MDARHFDILIIGGGASGLAAAVSASGAGARAAILERQSKVGRKLLATGNGRCNLTNRNASERDYHGDVEMARPCLAAYPPDTVVSVFRDMGLLTHTEEDGRVYPFSDQASSVLDTLRLCCRSRGVSEICDFDTVAIERRAGGFACRAADGRAVTGGRVILAVGSPASPKLGGVNSFEGLLSPFRHAVSPCYPALTQLKTPPDAVAGLKGIRYAGAISLLSGDTLVKRENGEILFTEYGLSGIAAMQLSGEAARRMDRGEKLFARLEMLPVSASELRIRRDRLPERTLEDFLTGTVHKRLGQTILKQSGVAPLSRAVSGLREIELERISANLRGWTLPVTGTRGYESAQVMAGGARLTQFDPHTLESRLVPGLYACGELLNIDGDCGGYNLHWAWASGFLAGRSAAK